MDLYHGTSKKSATAIMGPPSKVDVTKGGGELGRGFYLGGNPSLAASLAKGKFKKEAAVLQFTIDIVEYMDLDIHVIKERSRLIRGWDELKKTSTTETYLFNKDVIVAPFATIDIGDQYKFESLKGQDVLNKSTVKNVMK